MKKEIQIQKLRQITEKLFIHLENKGIKSVVLDKDYYWNIPLDVLYDPDAGQIEHECGQLYDDLEFIEQVDDADEAVPYLFIHLAPLLRFLAEKSDIGEES